MTKRSRSLETVGSDEEQATVWKKKGIGVPRLTDFEKQLEANDAKYGTHFYADWLRMRDHSTFTQICTLERSQSAAIAMICANRAQIQMERYVKLEAELQELKKELRGIKPEEGDGRSKFHLGKLLNMEMRDCTQQIESLHRVVVRNGEATKEWHRELRETELERGQVISIDEFGKFIAGVRQIVKQGAPDAWEKMDQQIYRLVEKLDVKRVLFDDDGRFRME